MEIGLGPQGQWQSVQHEPGIEELVKRARAGDRAAFAMVLERHYDMIYRAAYRWCGHESDAQDITQDVCVKLGTAIAGFDGRAAFSSWLYRIVLNMVRDRQRQGARQTRNVKALSLVSATALAPEQETAVAEHQLWQAVRQLPEKQRDAVLLVYAEEMTHAAAAEIMGTKENTVSWYIHEAKKALRSLV